MARLKNWQNNLTALIDRNTDKPFEFVKHNCLLWAFDGIKSVTGTDLSLPYRGNFTNEKSASKLLKSIDQVKTSQELLQKKLGELRPIAFARQGDIVFANSENSSIHLPTDTRLFGPVPGVCYGSVSFFVGEHGLISIETLRLGETIWVS